MTSPSASTPPTPKGTGTIVDTRATRHSRMLGVGAYRPARVVMNSEIVDKIDSSDEWIRERSGIVSRHFAADDESVIDMAEHASRQALEHAGITADQIGFVLLATVTHPYQTPAAAPELAARLGSTAPAVDISAACAGYCYGVAMASDMVKAGSVHHVLVIGVEKLSDFTDPYDRGSAFIFGDGAGACVIGPSDTPGIGPTVWDDGVQRDAISQRQAWTEVRESWRRPGRQGRVAQHRHGGSDEFSAAGSGMAPVAQQAIDAAGITADDLDAFIPHQANIRIIDAMVKQLKLRQTSRSPATSSRPPTCRRLRATRDGPHAP